MPSPSCWPDDVLIHVMKPLSESTLDLYSYCLVNKAWNHAASLLLYQKLKTKNCFSIQRLAGALYGRHPTERLYDIRPENSFHMMRNMTRRLSGVKTVDLTDMIMYSGILPNIEIVLNTCQFMTTLILKNCSWVTGYFLKKLVHCRSIQVLNLYGCASVSQEGLACLVEQLPQLRHLNIQNCTRITSLARVFTVASHSLEFVNASGLMEWQDATESLYHLIEKNRACLEYLNIDWCPSLDAYFLMVLEQETDDKCLSRLHTLCLSKCANCSILKQLVVYTPHVHTLKLVRCPLSSDALKFAFLNLPHLNTIDLSYIDISDDTLRVLCCQCPIVSLSLRGCVELTNDTLSHLTLHSHQTLASLCLDYNITMTSEYVLRMVQACLHLQYLSLCYCTKAFPLGIQRLSWSLNPHLDPNYVIFKDEHIHALRAL